MSVILEPKEDHLCLECQQPLYGRVDQKFCNDTCRNTFNRRRHQQETRHEPPFIRQILNIIRRNHQILTRFNNQQPENRTVSRHELIEAGFHFKYYTSIYRTQKNDIYHYCFEQGWIELASGKILLVLRYEQVAI